MTTALRSDQGSTLIEVLITIVILGLAGVALLGGMGTGIKATGLHQRQADAETILANVGEALLTPNTAYVSCATQKPPGYPIAVPTGWTKIVAYQYWDWRNNRFSPNCNDDPSHSSVQLVTITVISPQREARLTRSFVKGPL